MPIPTSTSTLPIFTGTMVHRTFRLDDKNYKKISGGRWKVSPVDGGDENIIDSPALVETTGHLLLLKLLKRAETSGKRISYAVMNTDFLLDLILQGTIGLDRIEAVKRDTDQKGQRFIFESVRVVDPTALTGTDRTIEIEIRTQEVIDTHFGGGSCVIMSFDQGPLAHTGRPKPIHFTVNVAERSFELEAWKARSTGPFTWQLTNPQGEEYEFDASTIDPKETHHGVLASINGDVQAGLADSIAYLMAWEIRVLNLMLSGAINWEAMERFEVGFDAFGPFLRFPGVGFYDVDARKDWVMDVIVRRRDDIVKNWRPLAMATMTADHKVVE
jgi:hypothetical protein